MRISIDTAVDDFDTALAAVYSAYGQVHFDETAGEDDESETPAKKAGSSTMLPGGWNEKRLRKWASHLTENAQVVSLFVAQNAPEVSFEAAARHLGEYMGLSGPADGKVLGGSMSSGGHALNKIAGVTSQPFDRDWSRGLYVIDERVAKVLIDALAE
jgi:hypothetical protein